MATAPKKAMTADDWARIAEIYERMARLPTHDREQALARLPEADAVLVPEIRKLLERGPSLDKFLSEPIAVRAVEEVRRLQVSPTEIAIGENIGDYEVLRPLGRGGSGIVYLCRQKSLDRRVAVKVVPVRRSLIQEARAMAVLTHENIVQVYGEWVDETRGLKFLAMQYVPGISLEAVEKLLQARAPSARTGSAVLEVVDKHVGEAVTLDPAGYANREMVASHDGIDAILGVGVQLANALSYAHERGVLHLDVKAANVMLTPSGRPMLTDFGVALRGSGRHRNIDNLGGTIRYMPPEQLAIFESQESQMRAAVEQLDGRADVFALGKVLIELAQDLDVPEEMAAVLRKATREKRDERFKTGAEFAAAMENILHWRRALRAMPPPGAWLRISTRAPLVALTVAGAVPQLVASFVGFQYNSLRVVSLLSTEQQQIFQRVNGFYAPFVFVAVAVFWVAMVARLSGYFRNPTSLEGRPEALRQLRAWALRLPWVGVMLTLVSWLPGAVVLPVAMNASGPVMFHLAAAFVLSCSLALGYTFLLHSAVVVRILYPRMWVGDDGFSRLAPRELARFSRVFRTASVLVGAMPLLGAFLILWQGAERTSFDAWFPVQLLVSGLMVLATFGMTAGATIGQRLVESVRALRRD